MHRRTLLIIRFLILGAVIIVVAGCKTPSIIVTQEQQQGDYYHNNHQYEQAITHYKNCLAASAKLGTFRNLDMEADICRKIAQGYSVLGRYNDALEYAGKALVTDSIQGNTLEFIEDYRMTGNIYLYKGDFVHGIPILERTLKLNEGMESSLKGSNQRSISDTYLSLAQVNAVLGQFNSALEHAESALDLYKKNNDTYGQTEALLVKGNIYVNQGLIPGGISCLEESLGISEALDLSSSRQHQALGEAYSLAADFEQAMRHKMNALDEAYNSRIVPQMIWANMGVGDAYADLGDYENAASYYQRAADLKDTAKMEAMALQASADMRLGNLTAAQAYYDNIGAGVASGLLSLRQGEASYEAGNTELAITHYQNAASHFQVAGVPEGSARSNLRLGDIYVTLNNPETADVYLSEASRLSSSDETRWEILYHKGRLFEATGLPDSAITAYKNAVEIIESIRGKFKIEEYKTKYIENKVKVYDKLIRILLENGQSGDAFMYSERARARAFLDMIANQKIEIKQGAGQELIKSEQVMRLKINSLAKMIHADDLGTNRGLSRVQVEKELMETRKEYDHVLERIKLMNREYSSIVSVAPPGIEAIQNSLDDRTVLLTYYIGDDYLAIMVISNNSITPYYVETESAVLSKEVADSRRAVRRVAEFRPGYQPPAGRPSVSGADRSSKEQLKYMYDLLIQPVYESLKDYNYIGIVPHGTLHFLPFQALIAPDGQFMIENHAIFYSPSASIYVTCSDKKPGAGNEMLAMALGELSLGDFSGLPGTTYEVEQISHIFDNKLVRFEQESSETFIKNNAADFNFIHLATHGIMDYRQPMYSYLLFNPTAEDDGLLTVHEVFGLYLNASLVTLSACQTGLGDISKGDEIIGLSRAFIYAGSPAVIVSLWSVADQPTAILMTEFYKFLEHYPSQEALRLAQLEVMKQYPAPFHWAPFQLIGR
jgi:CHAT domain-containing protein